MEAEKGCILIPAYNEAGHIESLLNRIVDKYPVIVVDDGSKDETAAIAGKTGAKVYQQIPNQGKGAALIRGFREALSADYAYVVTLDADGQHDPDEIVKFVDSFAADQGDLIIGYRNFREMPFVRRLSNTLGGLAFSWAMRQKIVDNQSGYRLMSARMIELILDSDEQGFEFEVEMIVRCIKAGYKLDWVPIKTIYADETSHIQPLKHLVQFSRIVLQTRKKMSQK